ncbi:MAG TPA: hypothetical protein DCE42_02125 [Myxococcales bacterium]|nr:hypothetical protein [Deltaproteobacteria bacterium]HAA53521.1 hypothetical protein [Myxococcales bacterium]
MTWLANSHGVCYTLQRKHRAIAAKRVSKKAPIQPHSPAHFTRAELFMCMLHHKDTKSHTSLVHLSRIFRGLTPWFLATLACLLLACPLQRKPLRPYPPPPAKSSAITQKVRWFRTSFYNYYQLERQLANPQDRLRRLIKQFPNIATLTFFRNQSYVEKRKKQGQRLNNLAQFYMLMNLLIKETIPIPSTPPKQR